MRFLKTKYFLNIVFYVFISCNTTDFNAETEAYNIINNTLLNKIESLESYNKYYNKSTKQIFEIPLSQEEIDWAIKIIRLNNFSDSICTVTKVKKWDKFKLDSGVLLVKEKTYSNFKSLNNSNDFSLFIEKWEQEIGNSYINMSNIIFNKKFDKAYILCERTNFNWMCGTGKIHFFEFLRKDNEWIINKDFFND